MPELAPPEQKQAPPPRARATLLQKLALSVGTLAVILVLGEVGLRVAGFAKGPARFFDPQIGYRFLPNQSRTVLTNDGTPICKVTFNEEGFRGPLFTGPKPEGTTRIACVGDSFTFGWGVEDDESFPAQLAARIEERAGAGEVEVNNFGVPGYNLWNSRQSYLALTRPTEPDVVLIAFYLNDLSPPDVGPRNTDTGFMRLIGKTALAEAFHIHLRRHFSVFSAGVSDEARAARAAYKEHRSVIHNNPAREEARPFWTRTMAELADLVATAREDTPRVLVTCFPSWEQMKKIRTARRANRQTWHEVRDRWSRPQRRLAQECEAIGVPFVDLMDAFLDAKGNPFGQIDKGHPSPLGYEHAAEALDLALVELGYLD